MRADLGVTNREAEPRDHGDGGPNCRTQTEAPGRGAVPEPSGDPRGDLSEPHGVPLEPESGAVMPRPWNREASPTRWEPYQSSRATFFLRFRRSAAPILMARASLGLT